MNELTQNEIRVTFELYKGLILDLLHQTYGDQQSWGFTRGQILKLLSDQRGLEFKIQTIVKEMRYSNDI